MNRTDVIIVGAGLAGLNAARLLQAAGVDRYLLLDARSRVGGRIHALDATRFAQGEAADSFDLGATWIWPGVQHELDELLRTLGLLTTAQESEGDMLFERAEREPPARFPSMAAMPPSFRVAGGMSRLLEAVGLDVPPDRIQLSARVVRIDRNEHGVVVTFESEGVQSTCTAGAVMLALPPRLAATTLAYDPALPSSIHQGWEATTTHMAAHAKYMAVYPYDFWHGRRLSGEARSLVGPLGEIHDASSRTRPALFGFFAIPAAQRARVPQDELKQLCRIQLARLFGPAALEPLVDAIQDWSADPFTATARCGMQGAGHGQAPEMSLANGRWAGRIFGAGSEWSPSNPGYLAGAIEASTRAVEAYLSSNQQRADQ